MSLAAKIDDLDLQTVAGWTLRWTASLASHRNSYLQASPSHHENKFDCHSSRNIFSEFFRQVDRRVVEDILVDDSVVLVYNTEFHRDKSAYWKSE